MRGATAKSHEYAVSEVVGALILVLIAVVTFSAILTYVFPLPFPDAEINTELIGFVDNSGYIVVEHMGGEPLNDYRIEVKDINGSIMHTTTYIDDPWCIGDRIIPHIGDPLISEEDELQIIVFTTYTDGREIRIFDGILNGNGIGSEYESFDGPLMLISSLMTNSMDEDLICFNDTIQPSIDAKSYIYNWIVNDNSLFDLLMSFDTDSSNDVRDYSGNGNNGTIVGPTWEENGVIGGAYNFDGIDDYVSLPYCFDSNYIDEITIEAWIKTDSNSGTISSFNKDILWELIINDGYLRWITNADDGSANTVGVSDISDGNWHYIATTYGFLTGESAIYIDGQLDKIESTHDIGKSLGTGIPATGSIGLGSEVVTETIFSSGFESASELDEWSEDEDRTTAYWWENYEFERYASDTITPRTGSFSIGGNGDFNPRFAAFNRNGIDISGYTDVTVSVWYSYKNTEYSDEIGFYYKDGSEWVEIFEELEPEIGNGNQQDWTYAEVDIPNDIDNLILQFWWSTSSSREYMAIDDLLITGIPATGGGNFSGYIDEFKISNRVLSEEQIYQNYLSTKDGFSDSSVIVSDMTSINDIWKCYVTPNDALQDDVEIESNSLQIINYSGGE